MENIKVGKPQYDSLQTLIGELCSMPFNSDRIEALIDMCEMLESQRDVMRDFATTQQSELRAAIEQLERSEAMVDDIQRQRQLEKEQYIAIQKAYTHQVDMLNIKFQNLVKSIKDMRQAQRNYFNKRKKGLSVTMCLTDLHYSQKLEKELDERLS